MAEGRVLVSSLSLNNLTPSLSLFRWNEVSWPYQTVNDNLAIYHQLLANLFGIW